MDQSQVDVGKMYFSRDVASIMRYLDGAKSGKPAWRRVSLRRRRYSGSWMSLYLGSDEGCGEGCGE